MRNKVLRVSIIVVLALFFVVLIKPNSLADARQEDRCHTFVETGKTVCNRFLSYWETHGGLAQFGLPISDVLAEAPDLGSETYPTQYFERARFELHLENEQPYDVLLSLLGRFRYEEKYPNGAPGQKPNMSENSISFPETGKRLGGWFLDYWTNHGGLTQQGYPISDELVEKSELDGNDYVVQYFERAVYELHPENDRPNNVLLSQLGTMRLAGMSKISIGLQAELQRDPKAKVRYLVTLTEQADTSNDIQDWDEKGRYVVTKLKEVADRTQPPVAALLGEHMKRGNVESFKSYYIINAFQVRGNFLAARAIASLPQIRSLESFPSVDFPGQ
jgi:hypothetical protein